MIHSTGKTLLPPSVDRLRKTPANISRHNPRDVTQLFQRPNQIAYCKPAILPIGDSVVATQAIEINRDVNVRTGKVLGEGHEMFAPIFAQDCATALSIFCRATVRPRMHAQFAFAFGRAITKKLLWPPALEISAAPNAYPLNMRKFERAIDPTAATPLRRPHIPIWMIIERDNDHRSRHPPNPESGQMMKIAGPVK